MSKRRLRRGWYLRSSQNIEECPNSRKMSVAVGAKIQTSKSSNPTLKVELWPICARTNDFESNDITNNSDPLGAYQNCPGAGLGCGKPAAAKRRPVSGDTVFVMALSLAGYNDHSLPLALRANSEKPGSVTDYPRAATFVTGCGDLFGLPITVDAISESGE